jgi:hypothetical protein
MHNITWKQLTYFRNFLSLQFCKQLWCHKTKESVYFRNPKLCLPPLRLREPPSASFIARKLLFFIVVGSFWSVTVEGLLFGWSFLCPAILVLLWVVNFVFLSMFLVFPLWLWWFCEFLPFTGRRLFSCLLLIVFLLLICLILD